MHRVLSTDCGTSCLTCGQYFHCDKCTRMSERGKWKDHKCHADRVADQVSCDPDDVCRGMDGDADSTHHWSHALPPEWRQDDPTTHYRVVECDFCGAVRGARE